MDKVRFLSWMACFCGNEGLKHGIFGENSMCFSLPRPKNTSPAPAFAEAGESVSLVMARYRVHHPRTGVKATAYIPICIGSKVLPNLAFSP